MKVMICPICGSKDHIGHYGYKDRWLCGSCKKEIIPLVTPQEIDND